MTKLIPVAGLVMLVSTSVIADTAPLAASKQADVLQAQRPLDQPSLLLVAGGVVIGGLTLVAGDSN